MANQNISPIRLNVGRLDVRRVSGLPGELGRDLQKVFRDWVKDLQWYTDQVNGFLPEDLKAALEPTFELSQTYCPVKTGALKASGYLEVGQSRQGGGVVTQVEMGYGANGVPDYAIFVHEIPATHDEPTSDKFMQRAIDEDYYSLLQRIVDNVRTRMGMS